VGAAHPGRLGLITPVDPNDSAVEDVIAEWAKTKGTVGIRLLLSFETSEDSADPGMNRVLAVAARYSLPVNLLCWGRLDQAKGLIARNSNTTIVIDHLGLPQPFEPPVPTQPWAELPKVLELAAYGNARIKITDITCPSWSPSRVVQAVAALRPNRVAGHARTTGGRW
jgi:L-fuconolactonase